MHDDRLLRLERTSQWIVTESKDYSKPFPTSPFEIDAPEHIISRVKSVFERAQAWVKTDPYIDQLNEDAWFVRSSQLPELKEPNKEFKGAKESHNFANPEVINGETCEEFIRRRKSFYSVNRTKGSTSSTTASSTSSNHQQHQQPFNTRIIVHAVFIIISCANILLVSL